MTAPTIFDGLHQIMHDNVTEYGHTINTLQRFNLYPEIVLGFGYRIFQRFAKFFAIEMETCWKINRGDNLAPVNSCVGMGNMHYFYINMVFGLAGSVLASVFLMGVLLRFKKKILKSIKSMKKLEDKVFINRSLLFVLKGRAGFL